MDECLGGDHAVEQFPARVTRACNYDTVGVRGRIIEGERRHRRQDGVQTRTPDLGMGRLPIDAAFEFELG